MGKEIERKFLVKNDSFKALATYSSEIIQGYLSTNPDMVVRIRIIENNAILTIKGRNHGIVRDEWEFEIPKEDAQEMLHAFKGKIIRKVRYYVPATDGLQWEVDCFKDSLDGLIIAEIEIPSEHSEVELPSFVGEEVTGNTAYYNSNLVAQV